MNQPVSNHVASTVPTQHVVRSQQQTVDDDDVSHKRGAKVARKARKKKTRSRKSKRSHSFLTAAATMSVNCQQQERSQTKLFVGQLPINFNEDHLRVIFQPFGKVTHLKVCREDETGTSKRCCFVTFGDSSSALSACKALHNAVIPGMPRPLQVKFADYGSNLRQRKLFIGMISKQATEDELMAMFAIFGDLEECTIIREPNGQSKGCAFVTYADRNAAKEAIENLHLSRVMQGCSSPIVVKMADSKAVKVLKRLNTSSLISLPFTTSVNSRCDDEYAEDFEPCRRWRPPEAPGAVLMNGTHGDINPAVFNDTVFTMPDCVPMFGYSHNSASTQWRGEPFNRFQLPSPSAVVVNPPSLDLVSSDLRTSLARPMSLFHLLQPAPS